MSEDDETRAGASDPERFVREVLGESPYGKQVEILNAVARSRRVSVVGCHGSGKDWAAARAVLWWVCSMSPAKVIVTGPTTRQIDDIVWREIRTAYSRAADLLGGRMFRTSRYEIDEETFALGFATNSPYNLQGFHSPNLLAVITEAHAAREMDIDAVRRLNPSRLLMTGNPFVVAGSFYDSHHSKRDLYVTVQIGADDTPNVAEGRVVVPGMVSQEDIDDRKQDWGEEDPMYIGGVLGRFPDSLDEIVVPLPLAMKAAQRSLRAEGDVVVACDVARFGRDRTVVVRRQGPVARIVWRTRGSDTMQIAGFLKSYCDSERVDTLVVDDAGVGGGVVDRLRQMRLGRTRLVPFLGGGRAVKQDRFANRTTEVWWAMRDRYLEGYLDTDDDAALIGQVSSRRYDVGDSRVALEKKTKMHRSPDEADALAMTFAAGREGVRVWV